MTIFVLIGGISEGLEQGGLMAEHATWVFIERPHPLRWSPHWILDLVWLTVSHRGSSVLILAGSLKMLSFTLMGLRCLDNLWNCPTLFLDIICSLLQEMFGIYSYFMRVCHLSWAKVKASDIGSMQIHNNFRLSGFSLLGSSRFESIYLMLQSKLSLCGLLFKESNMNLRVLQLIDESFVFNIFLSNISVKFLIVLLTLFKHRFIKPNFFFV